MRVRITFKVINRGGLVPFHHQFLISDFFKTLLSNSEQEVYSRYPFYSFSGLKGQTRLSRNGLHYNSKRATIVVSSADLDFIEYLVSLVLQCDELTIGGLQLIPEFAEEEVMVGLERATKYVCISPLVLVPAGSSDEAKEFIDPGSDQFSDLLYDSTVSRMATFGIDTSVIPDIQKFQLVPDEHYLNKLKTSNKKFARIYPRFVDGVRQEVRGYTFPFTLFAAPEIQEFIFTCGFGTECAAGFGMLDLANSNPIERTVPFLSAKSISAGE